MSKYYNKLESLRGFAAFAVVLYHSPFYQTRWQSNFVSGSYLFVDFFFILSGFVMTAAYQKKIADGFRFKDYFILRLARIYPLHLVLLLCWGVWILVRWILFLNKIEFTDPTIINTPWSFLTNLLLIHSLNLHSDMNWNYPSWSISVEFFAYLIFFIFVLLTRKIRFFLIPLLISLGSYYYVFEKTNWETIDVTVVNGIFRCLGGFFVGVVLAQIIEKISIKNLYVTAVLEVLTVIAVYWTVSGSANNKTYVFYTIPAFVLAIYVFSLEKEGFIGKLLQTKTLLQVGKYSYSIYMTHALIINLAFYVTKYLIIKPSEQIHFVQTRLGILINIGLVVVIYFVSKLTYHIIEKPWIEKSKKWVNDKKTDDSKDKQPILI